jgi:acetylornithine/N-succinyldiaminopimelate aminotransferase
MISEKHLFLQHVGQTNDNPLMLEIERAEGIYLYSKTGKKYIDLVSGVSVSNLGHGHPAIVEAIKKQVDNYTHLMVYGEYVQSPQVKYAKTLTDLLPSTLDSVYFVNSGSEAIEGSLKLAKRFTGRTEIIAFKNAYHGSTHGAISLMSDERFKRAFRPLLPDIKFLDFNSLIDLEKITKKTACVVVEPIQAEGGIIVPDIEFHKELRKRCTEVGAMLIFDEIQTGFGRTGSLFAFEKFGIVPDIMAIAKAMGGGMPIGGFVSSKEIMWSLTNNPPLGHITTFGGHPVSAAAALASLNIISENNFIKEIKKKEELFRSKLKHKNILEIRGKGLFLAVKLQNKEMMSKFYKLCLDEGIIFDLFLFCHDAFRIAPPLIISEKEVETICNKLLNLLDKV